MTDRADPVVSPADTIRLRLEAINRALYSTEVGVTREREVIAAAAALAEWEAGRERDRRQIARLTATLREIASRASDRPDIDVCDEIEEIALRAVLADKEDAANG